MDALPALHLLAVTMHPAAKDHEDAVHQDGKGPPTTSVSPGAEHLIVSAEQAVQAP